MLLVAASFAGCPGAISSGLVSSATAAESQEPFSTTASRWERQINSALQEVSKKDITDQRLTQIREDLARIRSESDLLLSEANDKLKPLREQLSTLGSPPDDTDPAEPASVASLRAEIQVEMSVQESRLKQIELLLSRIREIETRSNVLVRDRKIADVLALSPFPLAPATIKKALPEFAEVLRLIGVSPMLWWNNLPEADQKVSLFLRLFLLFAIAIAVGWLARRLLLRWFGRDAALETPSYARRLTGAMGEGFANGVVPALILAVLLLSALSELSRLSGLFQSVVVTFCAAAIFVILASALPRAVLAPDLPNWRLLPVIPQNAKYISHVTTILALVFAIGAFFVELQPALQRFASFRFSDELRSLYLFVTNIIEAIGVLCLCRAAIWMPDRTSADTHETDKTPADAKSTVSGLWNFWWSVRHIAAALAVVTLLSSLLGYLTLGAELINNLVLSGAVLGGLFLLRGLGREAIGAVLRTEVFISQLGLQHPTRNLLKFWMRAAYDFVLFAIGFIVISPFWGLPFTDVAELVLRVLKGFRIGNVTISPGDVLAAVMVFLVILLITRFIQRLLSEQVLPNTRMDSGVQHSLTAGTGYIGLTVALALSVTTLGLDLSNIAIIAGALSVGIGFGLQNIVNNFVSGLILLIERPIKVGDWVVIGPHEGVVKNIKVRATEIETFQRASIIIPNSELVSGAVTNWTLKDSYGRLEIPVGVAYGSDIEKVMDILMSCLRGHEKILSWPEPRVLFQDFGDSSLNFEARGFIPEVEWRIIVASELRVAINKAFAEANIEIPFPQRDLHIKDLERLEKILEKRENSPPPDSTD